MSYIDLNSDVGESFGIWQMGDDEQIFSSVSSANVACGYHAGDPSTIRSTCRKAVEAHIAIGAHVSYRDLAGFGRRFLDCSASELIDDIIYQLGALQALAASVGGTIRYVKPHGALYNAIVDHEVHAQAVVQAISSFDDSLPLLGLPGSLALRKAEAAGIRPVAEAFADRNYTPQGTLVSRREPEAVIHDRARATENMIRLASEGKIVAVDGSLITMPAESICLHSDTPGAVAMAAAVRTGLERAGLSIRSFV